MHSLPTQQCVDAANRFPNKTVFVRDKAWSNDTLSRHYLVDPPQPTPIERRVIPNIVLLNASDGSVFLETNSHGFRGPEINFANKLVAIWGDSIVAGWGKGWIEGLSEQFPGYQFLNGGVEGADIDTIAFRAIEANKQLPITCNLVFAGWNTRFRGIHAPRTVFLRLNRLLDVLPNPVLCTQPTSLNARIVEKDLGPFLVPSGVLPYRAGYTFWDDIPPTIPMVQAFYNYIVQQNQVIWHVVQERRKLLRQEVTVFDFFRHLDTSDSADFRDHFIDAGHFRVEAYPLVRQILSTEFAHFIGSLRLPPDARASLARAYMP